MKKWDKIKKRMRELGLPEDSFPLSELGNVLGPESTCVVDKTDSKKIKITRVIRRGGRERL